MRMYGALMRCTINRDGKDIKDGKGESKDIGGVTDRDWVKGFKRCPA